MIISSAVAQYIVVCVMAIRSGRVTGSDECPECGVRMSWSNTEDHIVFDRSGSPDAPADLVVIVACEGYICIDPSQVGMADVFPDWMSPDELHRQMGIIVGPADEHELGRMR